MYVLSRFSDWKAKKRDRLSAGFTHFKQPSRDKNKFCSVYVKTEGEKYSENSLPVKGFILLPQPGFLLAPLWLAILPSLKIIMRSTRKLFACIPSRLRCILWQIAGFFPLIRPLANVKRLESCSLTKIRGSWALLEQEKIAFRKKSKQNM